MLVYLGIFITSFILTYLVKEMAKKKLLMDIPNERSSHDIPTPRGGGMAIVVTWFVALGYLLYTGGITLSLFYALIAGALISIVSFLDDIYTLKSLPRMLVQVVAAATALYFIEGLKSIDLGIVVIENTILVNVIGFLGVIWFINLFNFIDGINGYSSSGAFFIALALFFYVNDNLLLAFAASILGFIPWNWGKARIFMGDIGSTVLGFTIAILVIYYSNTEKLHLLNGLVLTAVYWFDATLTLIKRFINKEKLTQAHKKHAYQRFVQAGHSHQTTTLLVLAINLLLFGLVYAGIQFGIHPVYVLLAAMVLLFTIYQLIGRKKPFE